MAQILNIIRIVRRTARFLLCLAAVSVAVSCPSIASPLTALDTFAPDTLYIVGRISFANFTPTFTDGDAHTKECYLIPSDRQGGYFGYMFYNTDLFLKISRDDYVLLALPRSRFGGGVIHLVSVCFPASTLITLDTTVPQVSCFELLIDLSVRFQPEDRCLYFGDIVFSIRDNEMFVEVQDHMDRAERFFKEIDNPSSVPVPSLEKRLARGSDFVEPRNTVLNGQGAEFRPML
ncbi:MAG TPA: hypothetical protein ENN69_06535 [Spirochaetia bacterium]|nr:hypothetical protein [Spirochaetia bacterium]